MVVVERNPMQNKRTVSSQPDKLVRMSAAAMRKPLSKKQEQELRALAAKPDAEIDYSDIAETAEPLFRPPKRPITIRLDADVLAWLKSKPGYQTRVNQLLREAMSAASRRS
jgi:uncharacterized protein (DUF4415 family)